MPAVIPSVAPKVTTISTIIPQNTTVQVVTDPNIPNSIPEWYNSRTAEAVIKTTILTALLWVTNCIQAGKGWDTWQQTLLLPILSGVYLIISQMWSSTVKGPFTFQNKNNLNVPIKDVK